MKDSNLKKRIYEEWDYSDEVGQSMLNKSLLINQYSSMLTLSWINIKSALVSGVITTVLGIAGYIIGVGDIFKLDTHTLLNVGALAGLTTIVSIIKSFLTTETGSVAGVQVVQPVVSSVQ